MSSPPPSARRGENYPGGYGSDPAAAAELAAQTRESQLIASTFANMELHNLRTSQQEFVKLYHLATKENERLTAELKERDRDAVQVLEYLRAELTAKSERLLQTEAELREKREQSAQQLESTETRYQSLLAMKEDELKTALTTITRLNKELEELSLFARERQELMHELHAAREDHQAMLLQYERELTSIRFQTIEEKVKLRAAEMELVKTFEQEVDARASVLVDVKAKNIHLTNQQLVKEKAMLEQEVGSLVVLTTEVKQELRDSKRGAELDLRIQEEALKHTAKLNKVAREADQKAQALETKCQSLSAEVERTLERERAARRAEVQALQQKNEELNRMVVVHRQELKKMRQLATTIVQQRSDLETFFHEALRDVRAMRGEPLPQQQQQQQYRLGSAGRMGGRTLSSSQSNGPMGHPSQWERIDNPTPSSAQSVQDGNGPLPRLVGSASSYAGSEKNEPAWYRSLGSGRADPPRHPPPPSSSQNIYSSPILASPRAMQQQGSRGKVGAVGVYGGAKPSSSASLGGLLGRGTTSSRMSVPSSQDLWLRKSTTNTNGTTEGGGALISDPSPEDLLHRPPTNSAGGSGMMMPPFPMEQGANFRTDLTWEEKEIVIQSLLYYLNRSMQQPVKKGGSKNNTVAPPIEEEGADDGQEERALMMMSGSDAPPRISSSSGASSAMRLSAIPAAHSSSQMSHYSSSSTPLGGAMPHQPHRPPTNGSSGGGAGMLPPRPPASTSRPSSKQVHFLSGT